jgi:hypothetical protein
MNLHGTSEDAAAAAAVGDSAGAPVTPRRTRRLATTSTEAAGGRRGRRCSSRVATAVTVRRTRTARGGVYARVPVTAPRGRRRWTELARRTRPKSRIARAPRSAEAALPGCSRRTGGPGDHDYWTRRPRGFISRPSTNQFIYTKVKYSAR